MLPPYMPISCRRKLIGSISGAARFLVHDDLGEHLPGDVLARFGVDHFELALLADHLGETVERDVGRAFGVVEPPVRVFLDDDHVVVRSRKRPFGTPRLRGSALAPKLAAPQHKPRPLPLFLEMLRSETAAEPARMQRALAGLRTLSGGASGRRRARRCRRSPRGSARACAIMAATGPPVGVRAVADQPAVDPRPRRQVAAALARRARRAAVARRLGLGRRAHARACRSRTMSTQVLLPLLDERSARRVRRWSATASAARWPSPPRRCGRSGASRRSPRPGISPAFPTRRGRGWPALWAGASRPPSGSGCCRWRRCRAPSGRSTRRGRSRKFEAYAAMPPESEEARRFVILEDWANDGPPLAGAAARELFETLFRDDAPGRGEWRVGGKSSIPPRSPARSSTSSRPATASSPRRSRPAAGERLELASGHVGMVIGGRAEAAVAPLADWLSRTAAVRRPSRGPALFSFSAKAAGSRRTRFRRGTAGRGSRRRLATGRLKCANPAHARP